MCYAPLRMAQHLRLMSCDWGTSSFRLRLLQGKESPGIVAERSSTQGILTFPPSDAEAFQGYLTVEIDRLFREARVAPEPVPIYLSGMITSSLGWRELRYTDLPFPLDGSRAVVERASLERPYGAHELVFFSGVSSVDDVMRGEETELVGILSDPACRGFGVSCIAVLPGTHSKVVEVDARRIVGFRTYMTGELFQVLRSHSILRHSVEAEGGRAGEGEELFEWGARRGAEQGLIESLFTVRANVLVGGVPRELNGSYLSGLLIGSEAASILRRFPPPRPIVLAGAARLQHLYRRAFDLAGAGARIHAVSEDVGTVAASLGHWSLRPMVEEGSAARGTRRGFGEEGVDA